MLHIPEDATQLIQRLNASGFQAYVVGGCVRDALMGCEPADWDICTSASPEEMRRAFSGLRVVNTGLKHGTLTVVLHHVPYEVTSFRVEGSYSDHRHPDSVRFVTNVRQDLARRDFTVNAMAWNPSEGLLDAFGGQADLRAGRIRCVGNPEERFREDALRILRALRFAAVFDFSIEAETSRAVHALRQTLTYVAAERVHAEMEKLLCGKAASRVLRAYADVLHVLLPEIKPMAGFLQHNPHHAYDAWEHTLRVLDAVPPFPVLRWAALFHDAGKPSVFSLDDDGTGHFYGHTVVSAKIAERGMVRLRMDHATFETVSVLVQKHDLPLPPERRIMRRRLHQLGEERLRLLIQLQRADALGTGTADAAKVERLTCGRLDILDALLRENACVSIRQLAVNGRDLLSTGWPGDKRMGEALHALLEDVLEERLPNKREALLKRAAEMLRERMRTE